MPLTRWGEFAYATDQSMATITNTPSTMFRAALEALIQAVAAGIIADNPTIIAAAEAAVADAIAAQRVVQAEIVASSGGKWTDLDAVDAALPVVLDVRSTALNRPITASLSLTGLHVPSGASNATQLLTVVSVTPQQWMRTKTSGAWSAWVRLVDTTYLDTFLGMSKSVHIEAGRPVWDGPDAPAATHYLLPDDTGALIVRPTPFPTPSASAPELTW